MTRCLRRCDELGHEAEAWSCTLNLSEAKTLLEARRPDVVFNLVESLSGTDRLMAAAPLLFDALQLPYTGVPTRALLITNGKLTTKQCLRQAGLPTAPWFTRATAAWQGLPWPDSRWIRDAIPEPTRARLAPLIVKAIWEHASFHMDDEAIVSPDDERRVGGSCCASREQAGRANRILPNLIWRVASSTCRCWPRRPVRRCCRLPKSTSATFRPTNRGSSATRPSGTKLRLSITTRRDASSSRATDRGLLAELSRLAADCWNQFGLRGYARVDFRVDRQGRPWILEVNSNPCLSLDAGLPPPSSVPE